MVEIWECSRTRDDQLADAYRIAQEGGHSPRGMTGKGRTLRYVRPTLWPELEELQTCYARP
jgi:hypothetical protein